MSIYLEKTGSVEIEPKPNGKLDLSIVVVSHDNLPLVRKYLPSFYRVKTQKTFELLFIENVSGSGTIEWVKAAFPQVEVISNKTPKSYAANVNLGIKWAQRGRYFAVFNPDVGCLPGFLDEAIDFLDAHPHVGLIGPQLLNCDGSIQESRRRFSTPGAILIRGLRLDRILRSNRWIRDYLMLDDRLTTATDVDWVTGAVMFLRRKAIHEVGGMDEQYEIAYSEDQDWCCRMWQSGWRVCYVPHARATHDHQRTGIRKPLSRLWRAQVFNAFRMFRKFNWRLTRSTPQSVLKKRSLSCECEES